MRLMVALARLVRGDYYHSIAKLYGIGKCLFVLLLFVVYSKDYGNNLTWIA